MNHIQGSNFKQPDYSFVTQDALQEGEKYLFREQDKPHIRHIISSEADNVTSYTALLFDKNLLAVRKEASETGIEVKCCYQTFAFENELGMLVTTTAISSKNFEIIEALFEELRSGGNRLPEN